MVTGAYHKSWFVVPGCASIVFPNSGSGPGQQLGDLIFNSVMGSVMQLVQSRLLELGLELRFPVRDAGFIDVGSDSTGSSQTYND
eukprot:8503858-Pyramimonas_sp.AAC.1